MVSQMPYKKGWREAFYPLITNSWVMLLGPEEPRILLNGVPNWQPDRAAGGMAMNNIEEKSK